MISPEPHCSNNCIVRIRSVASCCGESASKSRSSANRTQSTPTARRAASTGRKVASNKKADQLNPCGRTGMTNMFWDLSRTAKWCHMHLETLISQYADRMAILQANFFPPCKGKTARGMWKEGVGGNREPMGVRSSMNLNLSEPGFFIACMECKMHGSPMVGSHARSVFDASNS